MNIIVICTITTNLLILASDYPKNKDYNQSLKGKVPFLTIQDVETNNLIWDNVIFSSNITVRQNIFIDKFIISDEYMPFLSENEDLEHTVKAIYTEYYDLRIKKWSHELLTQLMNRDSHPVDVIKYESTVLDELYYYSLKINNESTFFIYFCIDDKVVHAEFSCKDNINPNKIISAIEIWSQNH